MVYDFSWRRSNPLDWLRDFVHEEDLEIKRGGQQMRAWNTVRNDCNETETSTAVIDWPYT